MKTKTGNGDKLFGSITSQDISDALKKQHKIEISVLSLSAQLLPPLKFPC